MADFFCRLRSVDLGGEELSTPLGYYRFCGRAGVVLGVRSVGFVLSFCGRGVVSVDGDGVFLLILL